MLSGNLEYKNDESDLKSDSGYDTFTAGVCNPMPNEQNCLPLKEMSTVFESITVSGCNIEMLYSIAYFNLVLYEIRGSRVFL